MALIITEDCINCDVCEPVCPNQAIYMGKDYYHINPDRCTECVGHFDEPQCALRCPVDCIPKDENNIEDTETLMRKKIKLHQKKSIS